jgi:hypothetical protein
MYLPNRTCMQPTALSPDLMALFLNAPQRFVDKLAVSGECVLWTAAKYPKGYGAFKIKSYTLVQAHRAAFEFYHQRPVAPGKILMHACDTPSCVNPLHLSEGTKADNNADMVAKNRQQKGSQHVYAVLTEAVVAQARARYASGETLTKMAQEYGVSVPTMHYAVSGKTWKSVKAS